MAWDEADVEIAGFQEWGRNSHCNEPIGYHMLSETLIECGTDMEKSIHTMGLSFEALGASFN